MKRLQVPFCKQDTDYTCGPATLQMVLKHFGIRVSELILAAQLKTDPHVGTRRARMREVAQAYGLSCYVNDLAAFEEFEFLMQLEAPTIIRFIEPDNNEDHYGLVIGANTEDIIIHDPWNGPAMKYSKSEFMPRWTCDVIGDCDRWLMAVSAEPLPLGRQFTQSPT